MQYAIMLFVRDQASKNGLKTSRIEQYTSNIYAWPRERFWGNSGGSVGVYLCGDGVVCGDVSIPTCVLVWAFI